MRDPMERLVYVVSTLKYSEDVVQLCAQEIPTWGNIERLVYVVSTLKYLYNVATTSTVMCTGDPSVTWGKRGWFTW